MGNGKTKIWISQTAVAAVLFYVIIMPLEVIFFYVFIPQLLRDHMVKLNDPTKLKAYPYKTKLPASPVFYLCQRHPELQASRIAHRALQTDLGAMNDDDIVKALGDIYHDTTWVPRPRVRFCFFLVSFFLAVPDVVQEVIFEEIFTVTPLLTSVFFRFSFIPGWMNSENRKGNVAEVVLMVSIIIMLLVFWYMCKALAYLLDEGYVLIKLRWKSIRHWIFGLDTDRNAQI